MPCYPNDSLPQVMSQHVAALSVALLLRWSELLAAAPTLSPKLSAADPAELRCRTSTRWSYLFFTDGARAACRSAAELVDTLAAQ